jgi:hypothetical protein
LAGLARHIGGGAYELSVLVRVAHCHVVVRDWRKRARFVRLPLLAQCDGALSTAVRALADAHARCSDALVASMLSSAALDDDDDGVESGASSDADADRVDALCLFLPSQRDDVGDDGNENDAALRALASARAIGCAEPLAPRYPDGRFVRGDERVCDALGALLHRQHGTLAPLVPHARFAVRVRRRRYALLSTYADRAAPATPVYVDPLAPARDALAAWMARVSASSEAMCVLHVHTTRAHLTPIDYGVRLVLGDEPLATLHARFGDELRRGLEPIARWSVRVVYADGASENVVMNASWSVEQVGCGGGGGVVSASVASRVCSCRVLHWPRRRRKRIACARSWWRRGCLWRARAPSTTCASVRRCVPTPRPGAAG